MKLKNKKLYLFFLGVLFILGAWFYLKDTYKVIESGDSLCTGDVPTSECMDYKVRVKPLVGNEKDLKVEGFSKRDDDTFSQISSKLSKAEKEKRPVKLKVDKAGYITEVK